MIDETGNKDEVFYQGPAPDLKKPRINKAVAAELSLRAAQKQNGEAGKLVAGVSPEEGKLLLKWIVSRARESLLADERPKVGINSARAAELFAGDLVNRQCESVRSKISFQATMLNLPHASHTADMLMTPKYSQNHGFSVISLPIAQPDGQVEYQHFLIDVTFKQFCARAEDYPPINNDGKGLLRPSWASQLVSTAEGKAIVDGLLEHGFVKLTPEVAERYIATGQRDPKTGAVLSKTKDNLFARFLKSTLSEKDDYDEVAISDADLRTPMQASIKQFFDKQSFQDMLEAYRIARLKPEPKITDDRMRLGNFGKKDELSK